MFHSLTFLKLFCFSQTATLWRKKLRKKLFPLNRKDILGKREKLSGHKSVGEFFDTCILRVRSPTLTRIMYPYRYRCNQRKPKEVEYAAQNYKLIHCHASTSGRRVFTQPLSPAHKCFRKSTYDIGNLVCFKLPRKVTIKHYF